MIELTRTRAEPAKVIKRALEMELELIEVEPIEEDKEELAKIRAEPIIRGISRISI